MKYILFLSVCLFAFSIHGQQSYIYITKSELPRSKVEIIGDYDEQDFVTLQGHVSLEDTTEKYIFADVKLLLEIDGVLYGTSYGAVIDRRDVFMIRCPKCVYENKSIKKTLKIERLGCKTELINIDEHCEADTMEIVLKKQLAAYPSVKVKKNSYYIDVSTLNTRSGGMLPSSSSYFTRFYNKICTLLTQDNSWKKSNEIIFLFDFDENGNLININNNIQNNTLVDFFKQQEWYPACSSTGFFIPLNVSLTIHNNTK